jgi:hypothetical protein
MQTLSVSDAFWLLIAALLVLPAALALCLKLPAVVALGFVTILFAFSSSTWGQVEADNTIYARGTGLFYFSLLNILLWIAGAATLLRSLTKQQTAASRSPFSIFFLCFLFLLAGHLVLGLMAGQSLVVILGYNGFINVLNMLVFCLLLQAAFESEQDRHRLLLAILALALGRAVFGMVRFLWFGGDSANPYRNFENLDITLFYFDIADNFVAALAAFCIAWLLLMPGVRLSLCKRCVLLGLLALEIAAVALSFRRSSLIGLALMGGILLWRLPWQRRLQCLAIGALALPVAAMAFLRQRLQFNSDGGSFLSSLLYDVGPDRTTEVSRFYELEAAAQSMDGNWLFGLGSWGRFYGNEDILDYHFGKFDFVHSGFGHLILKSGLAGLALFLALLTMYVLHYVRSRPALAGNNALLADAGFAGFLFWLPTLLVGTPVIELRTMLLLGLTLTMPYMAQALQARQPFARTRLYAAA